MLARCCADLWRVLYRLIKSDCAAGDSAETVNVSFSLDWTAITPHFDFDTDLCSSALASSIAREPWTRRFFNDLRM